MLSLPIVQTQLAQYTTKKLNDRYGTQINVGSIRVSLISWDTALNDIFIADYQQDTLFYVKELKTSILSMGKLAEGKLEFGTIKVDSLHFKLKTYYGQRNSNIEVFVDKLEARKPKPAGSPSFFYEFFTCEHRPK